jgi:hypothetical protein
VIQEILQQKYYKYLHSKQEYDYSLHGHASVEEKSIWMSTQHT